MRARSLSFLLLAWAVLPARVPAAEPTQETLTATSWLTAEDREHPTAHLLPVVVTRPFRGGARVCGSYENDVFAHGNQGRVKLEVGLWRDGTLIESVVFKSRRVRLNEIDFGCKAVPRLRAGDTLLFDFRFSNMPRLEPRSFSHGHLVNTGMVVSAHVEPPPAKEPSTIEFLGIEPAFGSRVPAGGKIKVRIAYTCNRPLGCNVVAYFDGNGRWREEVRWVAPGSRARKMTLRCPTDSGRKLVKSGLLLEIERSVNRTLDVTHVAGELICLPDGSLPARLAQP